MILDIADWQFRVDLEATRAQTAANSLDHCTCGYCRNYYQAVERVYPDLYQFLDQFGICMEGPSELMPFEPTLLLACYRVTGEILRWGAQPLGGEIPVSVGAGEEGTFLLWVGELELPWIQSEPVEDVVSPANLPEFLERMEQMWLLRHGEVPVFSALYQ